MKATIDVKKMISLGLMATLIFEPLPLIPIKEAAAKSGPERIGKKYEEASAWFTAQNAARRAGNTEDAVKHQSDIWSLIEGQIGQNPSNSDGSPKDALTDEEKAKVKEIFRVDPSTSKQRPMESVIHIPEESWYYVDYFDVNGNLIGTKKVFSEMIGDKVTNFWTDKDGVLKRKEETSHTEIVVLPTIDQLSPRATPDEAEHPAELTDQEKEEALKILGATPVFKTMLQGYEGCHTFYFDANGNLIGSRYGYSAMSPTGSEPKVGPNGETSIKLGGFISCHKAVSSPIPVCDASPSA